jgi:uncharacterized membrane protein (UPF0182 family)
MQLRGRLLIAFSVTTVVVLQVLANLLYRRYAVGGDASLSETAHILSTAAHVTNAALIMGLLVALGRCVKRIRELESGDSAR